MDLLKAYENKYKNIYIYLSSENKKTELEFCEKLSNLTEEEIVETLEKNLISFLIYYTAIKESIEHIGYDNNEGDEELYIDFFLIKKYFDFNFIDSYLKYISCFNIDDNITFFIKTENTNFDIISLTEIKEVNVEEGWERDYYINNVYKFIADKFFDVYSKNKSEILNIVEKNMNLGLNLVHMSVGRLQ